MPEIVQEPLPYDKKALAPHISEETLNFHYGKHHAGYVTKLNGFIKGTPNADKTLDELMLKGEGPVFNNAAQIWNHTFYWKSMSPKGGKPTGPIAEKIAADFGSFDNFKTQFTAAAAGHFGSGWAWLVLNKSGKLEIVQTHDAGNPLRDGTGKPLLTCDVWEHAYYIDYRNARPDYIASWWNLVNFDFANQNLNL
eukprot:GEMP01041368.1.p1 GENE.GEMP01041368.1~~GEMP01041368.1.p1  ORF type:complete len:207 (+),score=43.29 GEMP01041368.1:39-623(+)